MTDKTFARAAQRPGDEPFVNDQGVLCQVVPIEPTEEMVRASLDFREIGFAISDGVIARWKLMLAALREGRDDD